MVQARIKTKAEFAEKMGMALNIQTDIQDHKATKEQENTFLVLMDELKEFKKLVIKK